MPPEFFVVVLFLKYGVGLVQGVKSRGGFFFFFLVLLAVEPALKVTVSLALQMALVTSVPPSPTR